MDRHPYDAKVLTSACGLITNLAYDEEIAQNISCHGIHKIVSCMAKHEKVNHLQRNASAALSNLSATKHFVQLLVTYGGIEAMFRALDEHTEDADAIHLATGALQNFADDLIALFRIDDMACFQCIGISVFRFLKTLRAHSGHKSERVGTVGIRFNVYIECLCVTSHHDQQHG